MEQPIQIHQECLQACRACHETCLQVAASYLLRGNEDPLLAPRMRLLFEAANISGATADFIGRNSKHASQMCQTCALICETCAPAFKGAPDLDECAAICLKCAGLCEEMTRLAPSTLAELSQFHPQQPHLNGSHPL